MVNQIRKPLEKHSWWITIIIMGFMGVLSFLGAWQFEKVAEFPEVYITKEDSAKLHEKEGNSIQRELDRIHTRQDSLERKVDGVGDQVGEVKTLLIQMNNK